MNIEDIRKSYRPEPIRLLLIGESPPASGKFFYLKSNMTIYTARAFEKAFKETFTKTEDFLAYFKACKCYLDDLSHIPVDSMAKVQREQILIASIPDFAARLKLYKPEVIAIGLRKIEDHVRKAIDKAKLSCPVYTLPYAGNGHQNKYIEELKTIINSHLKSKT